MTAMRLLRLQDKCSAAAKVETRSGRKEYSKTKKLNEPGERSPRAACP